MKTRVAVFFTPPPSSVKRLGFLMNSGVLPDDKKELSSNEAKLIMIDVP